MWKKEDSKILLVRIKNGETTLENSLAVPQTVKKRVSIWLSNSNHYNQVSTTVITQIKLEYF